MCLVVIKPDQNAIFSHNSQLIKCLYIYSFPFGFSLQYVYTLLYLKVYL